MFKVATRISVTNATEYDQLDPTWIYPWLTIEFSGTGKAKQYFGMDFLNAEDSFATNVAGAIADAMKDNSIGVLSGDFIVSTAYNPGGTDLSGNAAQLALSTFADDVSWTLENMLQPRLILTIE